MSGRIIKLLARFFMRKQAVSLILLLVLIPLLNLGPSLHRLSCFGLHGDSCCNVPNVAAHCCCDHHSPCSDSTSQENAPQLSSEASHSDCPLCRFFAHFNAIKAPVDRVCVEFRCCEVAFIAPTVCVCEVIPDHARGPPALSFVAFV